MLQKNRKKYMIRRLTFCKYSWDLRLICRHSLIANLPWFRLIILNEIFAWDVLRFINESQNLHILCEYPLYLAMCELCCCCSYFGCFSCVFYRDKKLWNLNKELGEHQLFRSTLFHRFKPYIINNSEDEYCYQYWYEWGCITY